MVFAVHNLIITRKPSWGISLCVVLLKKLTIKNFEVFSTSDYEAIPYILFGVHIGITLRKWKISPVYLMLKTRPSQRIEDRRVWFRPLRSHSLRSVWLTYLN